MYPVACLPNLGFKPQSFDWPGQDHLPKGCSLNPRAVGSKGNKVLYGLVSPAFFSREGRRLVEIPVKCGYLFLALVDFARVEREQSCLKVSNRSRFLSLALIEGLRGSFQDLPGCHVGSIQECREREVACSSGREKRGSHCLAS